MRSKLRLSIRWKLALLFTLLFTIVFALSFMWFFSFATELAINELRTDLRHIATEAAEIIDAEDYSRLAATGDESDPAYQQIAEKLQTIRAKYPTIKTINTFVRSPNPDVFSYVVSLDDPKTRPHMLQALSVITYPQMIDALTKKIPTADSDVTVNAAGTWFSGYAPILGSQRWFDRGQPNSVGIVAVRIKAQSVVDVQNAIKTTTFIAFALLLLVFIGAISLLTFAMTRSLKRITSAAVSLERGEEYDPAWLEPAKRSSDELGNLARVFDKMAQEVRAREQRLRQQIAELRIEIDVAKRTRQVSEIADTDYFRELQRKARQLRGEAAEQPGPAPTRVEQK